MATFKGILTALVASYFLGLLFAYVFRVPIPFAGYMGPFGDISSYSASVGEVLLAVAAAWLVYGALGGFLVLAVAGGVAGCWAGQQRASKSMQNVMIVGLATLASAIPVTFLAVLDWLIGPW